MLLPLFLFCKNEKFVFFIQYKRVQNSKYSYANAKQTKFDSKQNAYIKHCSWLYS